MRRHALSPLAPALLGACSLACSPAHDPPRASGEQPAHRAQSVPVAGIAGTVLSGSGSTVRVVRADGVGGAGAGPTTIRLQSDEPPPPKPTASYPSLGAACDSVSATLTRRLHEPATYTADTTLSEWRRPPGSRGCVLKWEGTFTRTPDMSEAMWDGFLEAGWVPVNHISADGPDGSSIGMVSRTSLCIARTEMDGGDDGDSTYVAGDWWRLSVECDDDLSPALHEPE